MRKTVVRKAYKDWQNAKEEHASAERSRGWAAERWEKLPGTVESDRLWLTRAEEMYGNATGALTKPLEEYMKMSQGYGRNDTFTSPRAQRAETAKNTLSWARQALEKHERELEWGKDAYLAVNDEKIRVAKQARRDTFVVLSNYVQGYVRQNLKATVVPYISTGPHDESIQLLIINRTETNGEHIELVVLAERIITPKTKIMDKDREPREIKAKQDGDEWITMGGTVLKAMKGVRGAVIFGQVVIDATRLRQYMRLVKGDCLRITPATEVGVVLGRMVGISGDRHTAHFKHRQDLVYKQPTELRFVA